MRIKRNLPLTVTAFLLASVCLPGLSNAEPIVLQLQNEGSSASAGNQSGSLGGWSVIGNSNYHSANAINYSTGELLAYGNQSSGIVIRMDQDYKPATGLKGTITITNDGTITTRTNKDYHQDPREQHGIAAGFTPWDLKQPQTASDVYVTNTGTITTSNPSSRGIYIMRDADSDGIVIVDNGQGTIKTLNTREIQHQLTSDGIYVQGGKASIHANVGNIEISGYGTGATLMSEGDISAVLEEGDTVTTADTAGHGIHIATTEGNATVDISGRIETAGSLSDGVFVTAAPVFWPFGDNDATVNLYEGSSIETHGRNSNGISVTAQNSGTLDIAGNVTSWGEDSDGIEAASMSGNTQLTLHETANIQGGYGKGSALVVGSGGGSVQVINRGSVSALSDRVVTHIDETDTNGPGPTGNQHILNEGLMTGFMDLGSDGGNTFTNSSEFVSRNFTATDPTKSHDRTLRSVAVNDMGGDDSHVVNDESGHISLGASDSGDIGAYDATGYYRAGTGLNNRRFSEETYDFTRAGLLQTQFLNTQTFTNQGIIDLTGSQIGNTMVITSSGDVETVGTGTFVADGGHLILGAVLNDGDGGAGSIADMLIADQIELGENGPSTIHVKFTGHDQEALTASNGIQLVQVRDKDEGSSAAGAFVLGGANTYLHAGERAIGNGAYAYKLFQNGVDGDAEDGNWYLRSQLYQPGTPSYEAYPQSLLGLNKLPTLQQRVGNRFWSEGGHSTATQNADSEFATSANPENLNVATEESGVWGRIEGGHYNMEPRHSTSGTKYDQNIFKLQAGVDSLLREGENGKLIGGFTVHYGQGKTKTKSESGNGEIDTDGYGFGGTLTWYDDNGFYVDGQGQVTWYKSDLKSALTGQSLINGNKGFGYALSIETGKRYDDNEGSPWSLTPQAQLVYSHVNFKSFTDPIDARVSLDRGASLQGRLGLAFDHEDSWKNDKGMLNRSHVYGIANLYYEFLDGTKVDVAGVSFASKNDRLWGGVGFGGSYNWDDDKYSIYGEGLVNTSLNSFGDSYSIEGQIGFRVKW